MRRRLRLVSKYVSLANIQRSHAAKRLVEQYTTCGLTQHYRLVRLRRQFPQNTVTSCHVKACFHDTAAIRRYRHRRPYYRKAILIHAAVRHR